jgi:mortality factor 4-like protein 1
VCLRSCLVLLPALTRLLAVILSLCSSWDEWVPSTRLLKYNEQNIALQKSLQASALPHTGHGGGASSSARAQHGAGTKGPGTRTGARKDGGRGTKRGREEVPSPLSAHCSCADPRIL